MKCETCRGLKLESFVYERESTSTLAYYQPYYDQKGVYHNHNGNKLTQMYECSFGHRFYVPVVSKCPNCDWSNQV